MLSQQRAAICIGKLRCEAQRTASGEHRHRPRTLLFACVLPIPRSIVRLPSPRADTVVLRADTHAQAHNRQRHWSAPRKGAA